MNLINIINGLIRAVGAVISFLFAFLPPSPFKVIDNTPVSDYLPGLAWIIPFNAIITMLELWVLAIGSYYIYQIVLRWVKAIK